MCVYIYICRSQWPRGLRRRPAAACLLRSWVRIPPGGMVVCCECCVLSGRGLCDELITRPEESYRVWCVWVWSIKPREWGGLGPLEAVVLNKKKCLGSSCVGLGRCVSLSSFNPYSVWRIYGTSPDQFWRTPEKGKWIQIGGQGDTRLCVRAPLNLCDTDPNKTRNLEGGEVGIRNCWFWWTEIIICDSSGVGAIGYCIK